MSKESERATQRLSQNWSVARRSADGVRQRVRCYRDSRWVSPTHHFQGVCNVFQKNELRLKYWLADLFLYFISRCGLSVRAVIAADDSVESLKQGTNRTRFFREAPFPPFASKGRREHPERGGFTHPTRKRKITSVHYVRWVKPTDSCESLNRRSWCRTPEHSCDVIPFRTRTRKMRFRDDPRLGCHRDTSGNGAHASFVAPARSIRPISL